MDACGESGLATVATGTRGAKGSDDVDACPELVEVRVFVLLDLPWDQFRLRILSVGALEVAARDGEFAPRGAGRRERR